VAKRTTFDGSGGDVGITMFWNPALTTPTVAWPSAVQTSHVTEPYPLERAVSNVVHAESFCGGVFMILQSTRSRAAVTMFQPLQSAISTPGPFSSENDQLARHIEPRQVIRDSAGVPALPGIAPDVGNALRRPSGVEQ